MANPASSLPETRPATADFASTEAWQLVQRAAGSRHFARCHKVREFLLYICERSLQGRSAEVSEQQIGCNVFGRRPDYNPGDDNIVRVEARQLRQRLEKYFSEEGIDEPIVIEVPKGSYLPQFVPRTAPPAGVGGEVDVETARPVRTAAPAAPAVAPPAPIAPAPTDTRRIAIFVALALVAAAAAFLWFRGYREKTANAAVQQFWSALATPDRPVNMVLADSTFALLQDIYRQKISLEDYVSGRYLNILGNDKSEYRSILPMLSTRQHTSLADVMMVARLRALGPGVSERVNIRYARNMQIRDLRSGNAVLLGASRSNPWMALFEPGMNFVHDYDPGSGRPYVRNKKPLKGEQPEYWPLVKGPDSREAYAIIAHVPNLNRSGSILSIAGTSMEGTEAAGDLLVVPEQCERLLDTLKIKPGQPVPYFEVLIKAGVMAGSSREPEFVAVRTGENPGGRK